MGPRRGRGEMPRPLLLVFCREEGGRSFLVLAVFPSATSTLACVKGGKRKVGEFVGRLLALFLPFLPVWLDFSVLHNVAYFR